MLDAEEFLHLAINATQNGQHHAALEYLHKSLEQEPSNPRALFLLAAEHAELGLYERAILGMKRCLEIDPDLEMARYQLALLYMQAGLIDECREIWELLSENAHESAIQTLAQGLLIIDTDYSIGIKLVNQAAEMPTSNIFFQKSISTIRDNLAKADVSLTNDNANDSDPLHSLFLNAYNNTKFTKDEN